MKPRDTEILRKQNPPKKTVDTPQVAPQTPPGVEPALGQDKPESGMTSTPLARFSPSTLVGRELPDKIRGQSRKTPIRGNPARTTG
jgi:hypothetical protein